MKTRISIYHRTFACAYVLLVAVIFCGCEMPKYKSPEQNKTASYGYFYTYEYDSCEYVGNSLINNNAVFVHKGNCKFCAERSKK